MKKSSYMTRALKARDPRYARILAGLGYERADLVADDAAAPKVPFAGKGDHDNNGKTGGAVKQADDVAALRAEYQDLIGKRPFPGWGAEKLAEKIAAAKAAA